MTKNTRVSSRANFPPGVVASGFFGLLFMAIGLLNMFWGNDPGYGIFVFLLSLLYFRPVSIFLKKISGISVSWIAKIILGFLILWTALGVGDLADKITLMKKDFSYYNPVYQNQES